MTVYVCLDDNGGMLFNHRRQSRDSQVLEDIRRSLPGVLYADPFSEKLLRGAGIPFEPAPENLPDMDRDAHFFLESRDSREAACADTLVIYRWNRRYPADTYWDPELTAGLTLQEKREFPGSSHETVTKEVYTR